MASAAVLIALAASLYPAPDRTLAVPTALPLSHHGLLPEAHASHPGPIRCDIVVRQWFDEVPLSIRFITANGTYGINNTIDIRVAPSDSSHTISIAGSAHWLPDTVLELETGRIDRNATFVGELPAINTINEAVYRYTVQEGDYSDDLDYKSTVSLYWREPDTIYYSFVNPGHTNNPFDCILPEPGTAGSLSNQSDIVVDGIRPVALNATAVRNGTYGIDSVVSISAHFSEAVAFPLGQEPTLALGLAGAGRAAGYVSGNETSALVFNYTVQAGDNSDDLDYAAGSPLSGPAVADLAGNAANLTALPVAGDAGSLGASSSIVVDGVRPAVASVSSTDAPGTYGINSAINVTVTFAEDVTVVTADGTPYLTLDTGETHRRANYVSQEGARELLFRYRVVENDTAANLDYAGASALALNGSTIKDAASNAAVLALPDPGGDGLLAGGPALVIDGVRPEVASVSSPNASMSYTAGDTITVSVTFDDTVEVDTSRGRPTIALETGRPGSHATYHSGSGSPTLLFRYVVAPVDESDDLDYASETALVLNGGTIRDGSGNDADLDLPPPGSDGLLPPGLGAIEVVHVAPPLIPQDSADTGDEGYLLGAARAVDAFSIDGRAYAVVAASGNNTVQLIRVHENGTLSPAGQAIDLPNRSLATTEAVDAFRIGGDTFAIAASMGEGVQLIRMHGGSGTLVPEGRLPDSASLRLMTANDVAAFGMGGATYALVAALYDDGDSDPNDNGGGLQLVRVRGDATLYANSSMAASDGDPGFERLETPYNVAAFSMGGDTYALVTSTHGDEGVQLVRVRGDATLEAAGNATDGNGGFEALNGTRGVDIFGMGNATYALVAAETDDAVQLIRVRADGTLEAVSSAFNGTRGFDALDGAHGVSVFNGTDGGLYAIVASRDGDAVQLIHIHGDGTLLPAGSAAEGAGNPAGTAVFDELVGARAVAAFEMAGRSYAAVASDEDNGVQLIRMSPAAATGASIPAASGTYGPGAELAIEVAFHDRVNVTGRPELRLNSSASAAAEYQSGNDSRTLVFSYTVKPGDRAAPLDYDGRFALYGPGAIVEAETGVAANRTLPAPGSPGSLSGPGAIKIDGIAPRVAGVAAGSPGGAYRAGLSIEVAVAFTEPVSYSGPAPELLLDVGGAPRAAPYAGGNGTDRLVFAYTVRAGDSSDDLAYWNASALSGALADAVGNAANLTLPAPGSPGSLPGSGGISIDGIAPRVAGVSSATPDGAYRAGLSIEVAVAFTEPVSYSGPAPELLLNVSGAPAPAAYASGNGTDRLVFAYAVRAGDRADALAYWNASALSGALADAAGNPASLALPAPGSPSSLSGQRAIVLDTAAPRVAAVTSATPDGEYGNGARIEIAVAFTETVSYSGPSPELLLNVSGAPAPAAYASGNGTDRLVFAYAVRAGDRADALAYWNASALSGALADAAGNAADRTLPAPGSPGSLSGSSSVSVDGSAPSAATADAAFTGPNTIRIDYSAPLGPPAGHAGPVYGAVTAEGGAAATPEDGGVSGLGTAVHTVRFGGGGVDDNQGGTIALGVALEGREGAARYVFPAGAISVRAGEDARTLAPGGAAPVVAIESDGFVRAVNASGAGDDARPAINVTGLAAGGAGAGAGTVVLPGAGAGRVAIIASFAEVSFPPGAIASPAPAGGLLELYVSPQGPSAEDVAAAFAAAAGSIEVLPVVEVGGGETRIAFDLPVRILLRGQANGSAFYMDGTSGAVVPIRVACAADDTAAVHGQLGGAGECQIDSAGGADKIIYTYHLTPFGTARGQGGGPIAPLCGAYLTPAETAFGGIRAGERSGVVDQAIRAAGTLPLAGITISAGDWMAEDGRTVVMPANATSVVSGAAGWTPLIGEVSVAVQAGGGQEVAVKFRLDVPRDVPTPDASTRASQTITYTASCAAPPG